jgi:hypothetical protein
LRRLGSIRSGITGHDFQSEGLGVAAPGAAVGVDVGTTTGVIGETGLGLRVGVMVGGGAEVGDE